jgi:hypothetical protein
MLLFVKFIVMEHIQFQDCFLSFIGNNIVYKSFTRDSIDDK